MLTNTWTHYHIEELTDDYILLTDKCSKDKKSVMQESFKYIFNLDDIDDMLIRDRCRKVLKYSKKHETCPELHIHYELGAYLEELVD